MPYLIAVIVAGLGVSAAGIWLTRRDGRRIRNGVLILAGLGAALLGGLFLLARSPAAPLASTLVLLVGAVMALSYLLLAVFLIANGLVMWRRESRTAGNLLSLLAGVGMTTLVFVLGWFSAGGARSELGATLQTATVALLLALLGYVAFAFSVFLLCSWMYRFLPRRQRPEAIIVLGAGLIDGRVPPLLASRLDRALQAQQRFSPPAPLIITSGGQGQDEPIAEGDAMRAYLIGAGADPGSVVAETASRTTRQNLLLSRALLPAPGARVLVVTSSYHVFRAAMLTHALGLNARVTGAPTAAYYLPSATLREFVAVMRDNKLVNAVCLGLILALWLAGLTVSFWPG